MSHWMGDRFFCSCCDKNTWVCSDHFGEVHRREFIYFHKKEKKNYSGGVSTFFF